MASLLASAPLNIRFFRQLFTEPDVEKFAEAALAYDPPILADAGIGALVESVGIGNESSSSMEVQVKQKKVVVKRLIQICSLFI